ncbi:Serine/arginine repetitive matrix protein 2 [Thelotrema lepadinum]|nr:Serine/arginine repetitive matrix protein 2 [Thelotrema lepadinum]
MSSVSTPVIIVIAILAAALLITSAVLIYKLRPGRASSPGKSSDLDSEPLSPVRRLTVMHGKVVYDPSPRRSIFRRLSGSLYSSRRNSDASFSSLTFEGEPKKPTKAVTPSDLEAQTYIINQKRALYRIDEQPSPSDRPKSGRKQKKTSLEKPKHTSIPHDSLTFSSWQDYNGHRQFLDELASPIAAFSPTRLESKKPSTTSKDDKQGRVGSADRSSHSKKAKPSQPEMSSIPSRKSSLFDKELPEPPKSRGKRPQKTTVDTTVIKSASVSAKPKSAYSSKPTPVSSLESNYEKPVSTRSSVYSTDSDGHQLGPLPDIPKIDLALMRLITSTKFIDDDPKPSRSATLPVSHYSRTAERQSRTRSRSESRSRSRSRSKSHHSHSRSLRSRKPRPPPIKVVSSKQPRALPTVVRTAASSEASGGKLAETPATLLYSPDSNTVTTLPQGPSDEKVGTPPPFLSARITSVFSSPSFSQVQYNKNRQSVNTIATSEFSPTYSLASVKRVPLYPGKQNLQSFKRKPVESAPMASHPPVQETEEPIPSALQASVPSAPQVQWPGKPVRRQSIQAQDYSVILSPPKQELLAPRIQVQEVTAEPDEYKDIVIDALINHQPFENSREPPTTHKSVPPPPKTAYSGLSLEPRERVISIPTGRRRNSRYSHLFEKTLPTPPPADSPSSEGTSKASKPLTHGAAPATPPASATRQPPTTSTRRVSSVHVTLPYPRDSRLWAAPTPGVADVSPVATPARRKSSADQTTQAIRNEEGRQGDEVSPLSDDFPAEAAKILGKADN